MINITIAATVTTQQAMFFPPLPQQSSVTLSLSL